jgi:hypothetical protein
MPPPAGRHQRATVDKTTLQLSTASKQPLIKRRCVLLLKQSVILKAMTRKPGELKILAPDVRAKLMGIGLLILAVLTVVSLSVSDDVGLRGTIDIATSEDVP